MRTLVPKKLIVQIDSREKYPLIFPANLQIDNPNNCYKKIIIPVYSEVVTLSTGDYRLKQFPECCVVERKGCLKELYTNLYSPKDQIRQAKAFRKLRAVEHPYLMIEASPRTMLVHKSPHYTVTPASFMHRLTLVVVKYRLHPLLVPRSNTPQARRALGEFILHLMLNHALEQQFEMPVSVPETIMTDEQLGYDPEEI